MKQNLRIGKNYDNGATRVRRSDIGAARFRPNHEMTRRPIVVVDGIAMTDAHDPETMHPPFLFQNAPQVHTACTKHNAPTQCTSHKRNDSIMSVQGRLGKITKFSAAGGTYRSAVRHDNTCHGCMMCQEREHEYLPRYDRG